MRIGYITPANPFIDRKHWSGLTYKIRESIERAGYEVKWIPFETLTWKVRAWNGILKIYTSMFCRGERFLLGENFGPTAKEWASTIDQKAFEDCDYLFFPGVGQLANYIKTDKPIIYYSGATVPIMIGYYWNDICTKSQKIAIEEDRKASQKAFINLKASEWAINSIINDFKCDKGRSYVLEYGPALDTSDITPIEAYNNGTLRIMFSGVDWIRKNGDITVDTVKALRNKGIEAKLVIAGIRNLPEEIKNLEWVNYVGFLNKNTPEGYQKYLNLFHQCDIMLVPTKAECAGVVFCEASAFGMPSYTFATGGTTNYVLDGINGRTLPMGSSGETIADAIYNDIKTGKLHEMHNGSIKVYRDRLSWEAWSARFAEIIEKFK